MKIKILTSLAVLFFFSAGTGEAKELFTFDGAVNFQTGQFTLDVDFPRDSSIKATGSKQDQDDYLLTLNVEHLQSPFFELSSQIESSLVFNPSLEPGENLPNVFGKVRSQYSLLDYKPAKELSGHFEIKEGRVYFRSLRFADIGWDGFVQYRSPYKIDLTVTLNSIPMENFIDFWARGSEYDSSGVVSGDIELEGTLGELTLNGNLQALDGHIEKLNYDNIRLRASGVYPLIQVEESVISKSDGFSFMVDGPVNISDKKNFKKQVQALKVSPLVSDTALQKEWTIKKIQNLELGSTEFKYLLRKDGTTAEESAMLGVEQKLEF